MAINGVLRPGHVAIRVREMDPAVRHYTEVLGLIETARDAQGRVYLKAWDEHDHHSIVLREATDPGMDYMGWRVDSTTTLKKLAADVEGSGLASEMSGIPAGEHPTNGERFRFHDPNRPLDGPLCRESTSRELLAYHQPRCLARWFAGDGTLSF